MTWIGIKNVFHKPDERQNHQLEVKNVFHVKNQHPNLLITDSSLYSKTIGVDTNEKNTNR
jgi:hypothetical protein